MMDTQFLLNAAKTTLYGVSDYRLSKILGVSTSSMSGYRHVGVNLGSHPARIVANLLNIPLHVVYCAMMYERSRDEVDKSVWLTAYKACQGDEIERELREEIEKKPLLAA